MKKREIPGFLISVFLLLAGAALVCAGIWRGEATVILDKATKICLECIGIG